MHLILHYEQFADKVSGQDEREEGNALKGNVLHYIWMRSEFHCTATHSDTHSNTVTQ